eukprot:TRINITY_DN22240_c0_g1_i1.p1 TRINITY_DN22240_c0_g1~~TRINITY_DN22240_c0_g1_i1.p1  ORF type:complete len:139 (-),score=33.94 TRINITY_DN22240_c0_g1_i1:345-761(-)
METNASLPYLEEPHDAIRFGVRSLKEEVLPLHPAEMIQNTYKQHTKEAKMTLLRHTYGSAFVMRAKIEEQVLARHQRLPGLLSSSLGLQSMTGALEDFDFEDYLGAPGEAEEVPSVDLHHAMEVRLGMSKGPVAKGLF